MPREPVGVGGVSERPRPRDFLPERIERVLADHRAHLVGQHSRGAEVVRVVENDPIVSLDASVIREIFDPFTPQTKRLGPGQQRTARTRGPATRQNQRCLVRHHLLATSTSAPSSPSRGYGERHRWVGARRVARRVERADLIDVRRVELRRRVIVVRAANGKRSPHSNVNAPPDTPR